MPSTLDPILRTATPFSVPEDAVRQLDRGELPMEVLRHWKHKRSQKTVRVRLDDDRTAILKLWSLPSLRYRMERCTGSICPVREWRALSHLRPLTDRVPKPLAYRRLDRRTSGFTDALFL